MGAGAKKPWTIEIDDFPQGSPDPVLTLAMQCGNDVSNVEKRFLADLTDAVAVIPSEATTDPELAQQNIATILQISQEYRRAVGEIINSYAQKAEMFPKHLRANAAAEIAAIAADALRQR